MEMNELIMAGVLGSMGMFCFLIAYILWSVWSGGGMTNQAKQTYLTGIMSLFHEGSMAANRGLDDRSNPYTDPGPEFRAWLYGFNVRHRQISEVTEAVERVVHTSRQEIDRLRAAAQIESKPVDENEMDDATKEAFAAFKRRNDPPSILQDKTYADQIVEEGGTPLTAPIEHGQFGQRFQVGASVEEWSGDPNKLYKDLPGV
jgi:hypothetical protein